MFDADERIVIANDRFAEMYKVTPEQVKPGTTLRQLTELRIANDMYVGLTVEDVLNTMRTRVARGKVSHLTSKLGDGRTIVVSIQPRPDGGWVTTHQDVTERELLNAQLEQQNVAAAAARRRAESAEHPLRRGHAQHVARPVPVRCRAARCACQRSLCRNLWADT